MKRLYLIISTIISGLYLFTACSKQEIPEVTGTLNMQFVYYPLSDRPLEIDAVAVIYFFDNNEVLLKRYVTSYEHIVSDDVVAIPDLQFSTVQIIALAGYAGILTEEKPPENIFDILTTLSRVNINSTPSYYGISRIPSLTSGTSFILKIPIRFLESVDDIREYFN